MDITRHDGEGDIAFETGKAMIGALVQAMHTERMDRQFNGRVLSTQANKFRIGFAGLICLG